MTDEYVGGGAKGSPIKPKGKSFKLDNKGGGKGNRVPPPFPAQGIQPKPSDGSLAAMGYKNKSSTKA